jgi:hypothetical protein
MGAFLCGVSMLQTSDFFQNEVNRCRDSAERAAGREDREFWLNMARRWEELLHPNEESDAKAVKGLRSIYGRRVA